MSKLRSVIIVVAQLGLTVILAFYTYNQGWRTGYTLGRCETKCGPPPRSAERDPNTPNVLVCTCQNGDVFRLAE